MEKSNEVKEKKRIHCELCNKEYVNIAAHQKTNKHIRKIKKTPNVPPQTVDEIMDSFDIPHPNFFKIVF